MYSQALIAHRQQLLEGRLGAALPTGHLERYPVETCHSLVRQLAGIWDPERRAPTRPFTQDEQIFVANERLLVPIDFEYFAQRYWLIQSEGQQLKPLFPLWESQRLILAELAFQEESRWRSKHPDGLLCNLLKGRQLGACLDPATRVLTADLRWVPLDTIEPGDALIAVDEQPPGGKGAARRMRTAVTEARQDVVEEAFDLILDTGVHIVATAPHRFLARKRGQTETVWRSVSQTRVGDVIRYATVPWETSTVEDGWMGGMLDGEGSGGAKESGGAEFTISQVYGPVYDRLTAYFRDRGYASFHEDPPDLRLPSTSSKFGARPVGKIGVARMDELFRLMGQTRPTRFIGRRWWEGKELPGKRNGFGWARVVEIVPLGTRRMIDLQTSTKTFIAEGLVSHNSTLAEALLGHRVVTQTYVKALVASDVPANSGSQGIFGMLELGFTHLPWWLRPGVQFWNTDSHLVLKNGSSVIVESGKSMKGGLQESGGQKGQLGRSKTFSVCHLTELSTWEYAETIDDALMPAVPQTPRTLMIRESTAKGRHNWWHQEWLVSAEGLGRCFNIFIPWYAERSKYWLPVPANWIPSDDTLAFAQRVQAKGHQYMRRPISLAKEQLVWYEQRRAEAVRKEQLYKFLEEYPAEPEEAFQYSGRSIFSIETMDRLERQARPLLDLWQVAPHAELAGDREQLLQELAREQLQQRTQVANDKLKSAHRVNQDYNPQPIQDLAETPQAIPRTLVVDSPSES